MALKPISPQGRLGAMMASAHRDAFTVKRLANILAAPFVEDE